MRRVIPMNPNQTVNQRQNNYLKYLSKMYDSTLDNFPFTSFISLIVTIVSVCIFSNNLSVINHTFQKYNFNLYYDNYYIIFITCVTILHSLVFIHGICISTIETIRENKLKCLKWFKCLQKKNCVTSYTLQIIWGIIGTVCLSILYLFTISGLIISSFSTLLSYFLKQSCWLLFQKIDQLILKSNSYITHAKNALSHADNITLSILNKYDKMVHFNNIVKDSVIGEISIITKNEYDVFQKPNNDFEKSYHMRQLTELFDPKFNPKFDPTTEILKGRDYISVLNNTIINTEQQITHYFHYSNYMEEVCYDFAGIYNNFYNILISIVLLSISGYFIFATHYKYFSIYNYEIQLIKKEKNNDNYEYSSDDEV